MRRTGRLHPVLSLASLLSLVLLLVGSTWVEASSKGKDWPKWRGQKQDGKWSGEKVWRFDEGYGLKVAWKKTLGSSYSSISVAGGRAVTMFSDSTSDYIVALDGASGEEIWRYRIDETYKGHNGSHDGQISTPTIDGDRVYVYARKGQVLALDASTGKAIWQHDVTADFNPRTPFHGFGSSPVVVGDVLIVLVGGQDGNAVAGFDKKTGSKLWSTGTDTINYQSPVAVSMAGKDVLLCAGDNRINAQDPATGSVLWEYRHAGRWGSINPVVVSDSRVFINHNFRESMLLEISGAAGRYDVKEVWRNRHIRQTFNTSVYHDGYLYGYSSRFLTCVDASTGELAWKSRPPGDGFLILVDNHLVIITKQGTLHVAKASSEDYTELASLAVFDDLTWTPPSFADGRIYARSLREIAAIDIVPVDEVTRLEAPEVEFVNPGGGFAKFIQSVQAAPDARRQQMVEAFISKQKSFPIIEDERFAHVVFYGEAKDVAIVGDMLPTRQEAPLHRVAGTNLFFISFELEPDARLDYALRQDFDTVIADPRNPHTVPSFALPANEVSELRMPRWQRPRHLDEPTGERGTIETFDFESKILGNTRKVHVYLPPGYANTSARYPAVYVNYGNFAKDMALMPNTLDNLIAAKRIKPVVAVFVENPQSFREYARQSRDQHAQMFAQELIPHIDRKYRTLAEGRHRLLMGADEGGYAAIYAAFKYPGIATMLAGQSTHVFPRAGGAELTALIEESDKLDVRFYLDWATYGQRGNGFDWKILNRDFVKLLKEKGYEVEGHEVNEGFGWASWRNRTDRILLKYFGI